jgi:hypothetical protein
MVSRKADRRMAMTIDEALSELIGAVANTAITNGGTKIRLNELAAILTILDIESDRCDYYTSRTDDLIRKAYEYFNAKGDTTTADNIKKTFIKKNGDTLIP